MEHINRIALETAKEIAIACFSGSEFRAGKESGEAVSDFFEAIYNRALKIVKEAET